MCSGNKRSAYGPTQSYKDDEQKRLGDAPRIRDQIPSDAPKGTDFAAGLVDAIRPDIARVDKTKNTSTEPRTIKPGTTIRGQQKNQSVAPSRRKIKSARMGRRSGTNSLRIPRNTNTGSGNLNY